MAPSIPAMNRWAIFIGPLRGLDCFALIRSPAIISEPESEPAQAGPESGSLVARA